MKAVGAQLLRYKKRKSAKEITYLDLLLPLAPRAASGVAKQRHETMVHVLLHMAVKQR